MLGAPVVCLIGAAYVAALFGGGRVPTVAIAVAILLVVLGLTFGGARASAAVQAGLVVGLVALVATAVAGSARSWRVQRWTPFAPHGWLAVGSAAAVLMLSFVGWEAIAPMTARLRDPGNATAARHRHRLRCHRDRLSRPRRGDGRRRSDRRRGAARRWPG